MGRTAWLDCASGISGDMCLGALVDAGADMEALLDGLRALALGGYSLRRSEVMRGGLRATRIQVEVADSGAPMRTLGAALDIIGRSSLSGHIKDRAARIVRLIFEAEARVHGCDVEAAHLHELSATDTLVDIVGTLICLDLLGIERVTVSGINLGGGSVRTAHGILPVPAPATAELIRGMQAYGAQVLHELTTPTGAAIARGIHDAQGPMPRMAVRAVGYGAGSDYALAWPNVLRVVIGEETSIPAGRDNVVVIEANMDDMTPETLAYAAEELMRAGALDVWLSPVVMKKGRPGVVLSVMVEPIGSGTMEEVVLRETTTIGVRRYSCARTVLARRIEEVETQYGMIRVKVVAIPGGYERRAPEYEDCARAAREHGVPIAQVMQACHGPMTGPPERPGLDLP